MEKLGWIVQENPSLYPVSGSKENERERSIGHLCDINKRKQHEVSAGRRSLTATHPPASARAPPRHKYYPYPSTAEPSSIYILKSGPKQVSRGLFSTRFVNEGAKKTVYETGTPLRG